jgi:hypothetical protein
MARILADENFPLPAVEELRRLQHDVLTLAEAGKSDQALPDADVLALATGQDRILITFNRRDFIRLHQATVTHAGIIVCTFDPDFISLARRIDTALAAQPNTNGQLLRINRPA